MSGPLGRLADRLFEARFREALSAELGRAPMHSGFEGTIELASALVRERSPAAAEAAARRVLVSLFPDWPPFAPAGRQGLLYWFEKLFATPFPGFSAKMNAWVTWAVGQWLMGPCVVQALDTDVQAARVSGDGIAQQVLVARCRFLESSACASVCVNACKMPTQRFFNQEMGVPMRMGAHARDSMRRFIALPLRKKASAHVSAALARAASLA